MFDRDESKYELWEVKFLGCMRLQKLYDVVIPKEGETSPPNAEKSASAFAELVQCLDDTRVSRKLRPRKIRPQTSDLRAPKLGQRKLRPRKLRPRKLRPRKLGPLEFF